MPHGLLYKLRGIDKWPSTTATVTATEQVSEGGRAGRTMKIYFTYNSGSDENGKFLVDDNSSLYGLSQGENFTIQFNSRRPSSYYCEEASSLSQTIRQSILIAGVTFAVLVFLIEFFGR